MKRRGCAWGLLGAPLAGVEGDPATSSVCWWADAPAIWSRANSANDSTTRVPQAKAANLKKRGITLPVSTPGGATMSPADGTRHTDDGARATAGRVAPARARDRRGGA